MIQVPKAISLKMRTLVLTEKPSVARDFAKALGKFEPHKTFLENDQYILTWAIGHLLTPFDPEDYDKSLKKWKLETLPIWIEDFKYKSIPQTSAQLKAVISLLKRKDIDKVIVATDAGREGELIARLILNEVKLKVPMFRFFTSEALTSEVIARELKNAKPLSAFDRLYNAGVLRQKLDWLMGMNLTRVATLKLGDLFSIGRVQTAVLSLIVRRHLERENFKPEDYYELVIDVHKKKPFKMFWFHPKAKETPRRLPSPEIFEKLILGLQREKDLTIESLIQEDKTQRPWGVYSLTDLQRKANVLYGFSASKTLSLAQDLYEKDKCLSYPRTDSKFLGKSSFGLVKDLLNTFQKSYPEYFQKFDPKLVHPNHKGVFNDEKLTDHHGLIPLKPYKGARDSDHGKIYHLVLKELVANFSLTHVYKETKVIATHELTKSFYEARGVEVVEIGYKYLENKNLSKEMTNTDGILPPLAEKQKMDFLAADIQSKKTSPPAEYTEATLLYDMTNPARLVDEADMKRIFRGEIGLGTQATRANIIETLIKRGYIKREKKSLVAMPKGIELIITMSKMQFSRDITSVKQTAKMELALEEIAHNDKAKDLVDESLHKLKEQLFSSVSEWKALASVVAKNEDGTEKSTKKPFKRKGISGSGESLGLCPLCKQGQVKEFPKSYSCERWKDGCQFSVWKTISSRKITETNVKKLITKGKTDEIKGFKSKGGKQFSAKLILGKEGKVEFEFEF